MVVGGAVITIGVGEAGSFGPSGDGGTILVVVVISPAVLGSTGVVDVVPSMGGHGGLVGVGVAGDGAPSVVIVGVIWIIGCSKAKLLGLTCSRGPCPCALRWAAGSEGWPFPL